MSSLTENSNFNLNIKRTKVKTRKHNYHTQAIAFKLYNLPDTHKPSPAGSQHSVCRPTRLQTVSFEMPTAVLDAYHGHIIALESSVRARAAAVDARHLNNANALAAAQLKLKTEQYNFSREVASFMADRGAFAREQSWRSAIRKQLEWFIVDNIARDVFMQSHRDSVTGCVAISLLLTFPTFIDLI